MEIPQFIPPEASSARRFQNKPSLRWTSVGMVFAAGLVLLLACRKQESRVSTPATVSPTAQPAVEGPHW